MNENRRQDDITIQVIAERMSALHSDVNDLKDTLKDSMKEMTTAVTKLVLIEERQTYINQSYNRLSDSLDKLNTHNEELEVRIDTLEKSQPMTNQVVSWVMRAVYAIVAAAMMYIAKMLGFF